ncbi:hypothetical protein [Nonomuraea sp. NPDC005501]|uniref:hypothetical protein n=1 Tax=Nonomuraea sp. NPDC005501 TaxID=3156884 RepID=UPI0033BC93DB
MAARMASGGLRARLVTAAAVATLLVSSFVTAAYADPGPAEQERGRPTPTPTSTRTPPTLTPADGSYLEGTAGRGGPGHGR